MDTETLKLLLKYYTQGNIREREDAEADLDRAAPYLAAEVIKLRFEVNHGTSVEAQLRAKVDRLSERLAADENSACATARQHLYLS